MSTEWHNDHKKAVAEKWTRCPPVTVKVKELISGQVCMGTYGLVELEVMQLERELAEARAEIESKDKLIEQMRAIISDYRVEHKAWCNHDQTTAKSCTCELSEKVQAALAAERGE